MKRERIDKLLVERGLAESRTKAQAMVMAGVVLVDEQRVEKPSQQIDPNSTIRIKGGDDPTSRYVGRGGLKLEAALREFQIDVTAFTCLDVGASTGGFRCRSQASSYPMESRSGKWAQTPTLLERQPKTTTIDPPKLRRRRRSSL